MKDFFEDWYDYYPDNNIKTNPIPRPQPIDFVVSYFRGMTNGIFVDVGAYDGVTWSNSLPLEKYFGWRGLCIEPLASVFSKLANVRNATCINVAISDFDGETDFVKVSGYAEMLSGVTNSMNKSHIERIESEIKKFGGAKEVFKTKVSTLKTLLEKESISNINYMSIDVECGELNVLKGIPWEDIKIDLISCEVNEYSHRENLDTFLSSKGYNRLQRVCGDEFYSKTQS